MEEIRALIAEYPDSHTIARDLEWSVRTVKRDLALMQNRLNLPMEFDQAKNGWYFTKPVPFFPSLPWLRALVASSCFRRSGRRALQQYTV